LIISSILIENFNYFLERTSAATTVEEIWQNTWSRAQDSYECECGSKQQHKQYQQQYY
jgi:hypothetical protein